MTMILIAGGTDVAEAPGWGKLIGLVVAVLLFWAYTRAHARWRGMKDEPHSPTPGAITQGGVKAQVSDTADTNLTPRGSGLARVDDDLGGFVRKQDGQLPTKEIVKLASARFRASKSTVLRRLREAREARDGVLPEDDES